MALKLQTAHLYEDIQHGRLADPNLQHWAYNGLDSAVTFRVHGALRKALSERNVPHHASSYAFVRAMQGPAMSMMLRGVAINQRTRQDEIQRCQALRARAAALLNRLADAIWGPETFTTKIKTKETYTPIGKRGLPLKPRERTIVELAENTRPRGLNPASSKEVLAFFNRALGFPIEYEIRKTPQGSVRTPSAGDKALRKWARLKVKGPGVDRRDRSIPAVRLAAPFVSLILTLREVDKQLQVLRTPLDPDGRMRCSYNVTGTESGRWSSSKNVFGRASNLQNISPQMRRMFCADDGWRMYSTDLEQAESRVVGGLVWQVTGDSTYLDACESRDLHTTVCILTWPNLGWTDDDPITNRKIANQEYPALPHYSYRDVAKRLGHSANYRGSPFGVAQAVGIPQWIVEEFQSRYFLAFPSLHEWHEWIRCELRSNQALDTPLLRRRQFFGRATDDSTLREAIAFVPQSTVAEILNLVMYRVWERSLLPPSHPSHLPLQLLLQNHDAFVFQSPESIPPSAIISQVNSEFQSAIIPLSRENESRSLVIPGEFVLGWNWAYADDLSRPNNEWKFPDGNPDGLVKWKGNDDRERRQTASVSPGDWLSGPLPGIY